MAVLHFDENSFESEVMKSDVPVVVDFWATWCGPCQMIAPVIEQLEADSAGKYKVGKVDIDKQGELAARYGVMSIPTIVLFENGEPKKKAVGFQTMDQLKATLGI
ncbi:thioredoxin [Feifania hominis]|uniref:Thioredoxin n=1 Tax=Feifania hominis TaxID=2763660 RepID=A0A926HTW7_9FIRM|nr:thioredoxin [Feifania hominis]MBC8536284.1 thioredoxin [Feifania hominis]